MTVMTRPKLFEFQPSPEWSWTATASATVTAAILPGAPTIGTATAGNDIVIPLLPFPAHW
jgi:hypothetical protein